MNIVWPPSDFRIGLGREGVRSAFAIRRRRGFYIRTEPIRRCYWPAYHGVITPFSICACAGVSAPLMGKLGDRTEQPGRGCFIHLGDRSPSTGGHHAGFEDVDRPTPTAEEDLHYWHRRMRAATCSVHAEHSHCRVARGAAEEWPELDANPR
jgi:hypothetical protein